MTNDITLSAINKLSSDLWDKRQEYDAAKKISNEKYEELKLLEAKALAYLDNNGLKNFSGSKCKISRIDKLSFRVPTGEDLKLFIEGYEKENGPGSSLQIVSVNHQRINSYCNEEYEKAIIRNDLNFKIPGVKEPQIMQSISVRKA